MPRIVKTKGAWKTTAIEGLSPEDWGMLGSFEEWIPGANEDNEETEKKVTTKKKGIEKLEENEDKDKKENESNGEEKKKTRKRKKKSERKALKKAKLEEKKKEEEEKEKEEEDGEDIDMDDEEDDIDIDEEKKEDSEHIEPIDTKEWTNLCIPQIIIDNIAKLGFSTPTEIQRRVLPSAVRDRLDILGAAETGSGKTLAYVIPVVARLLEEEREGKGPRALILAPTRELVLQVRKQVNALIIGTNFRAATIVGGLSQLKQERIIKYRPEIIVATPGRLGAMCKMAETGSYFDDWSGMRCLVIDETDRMVEKGHFEEMEMIVAKIKRSSEETGSKLQTLVFSATLTFCHIPTKADQPEMSPEKKIAKLVSITGLRKERKIFDLTRSTGTSSTLLESRLNCKNLLGKDASLVYLIHRYGGRSIVFCNSVDASRRLYGILSKLRIRVLLLHAKMQQRSRLKNLDRFTQEENVVLLATDVAARGLDIKGIQHVFHYQVPKTAEIYIHRSGRTARASQQGLSILLVDPSEASFYRRICANLNRSTDLPVFPVDVEPLFNAIEERTKVASELDSAEHQLKKKSQHESWFDKAAREADLELDDRQGESAQTKAEIVDLTRKEKRLNGHLRALLSQGLPCIDYANLPNTRYVNPELASKADEKMTREAFKSAEEGAKSGEDARKMARKLLTTRHLQFEDKKKKGKGKGKGKKSRK